MDEIEELFHGTLPADLLTIVCGDKLGWGHGRHVYIFKPDPSLVIKFEYEERSFQNVLEWTVWDRIKEAPSVARWFCPIVDVSAGGTILLQKRTTPCEDKKLPKMVPAYFTDLKRGNWGLLDGRVVCHDYGTTLLMEEGMTSRMVKAEWWD